jgi:hypothetical protein
MQNRVLLYFFRWVYYLRNAHFDVVLRKPIFELQPRSHSINEAPMR